MTEKKIYRDMTIKEYGKKRYEIHNNYIIKCFFCNCEYKLNVIKQHILNCKRCRNIRKKYEEINSDKYIKDFINFNNDISLMKKNTLENYYDNEKKT
jgi:hypothetical protein